MQDVNAGEWQWILYQPLVAPDPQRQTVHVVMTYVSSAAYRPNFKDAHEYKRLNNGHFRELNHFVALSHDGTAKNHEAAVKTMGERRRVAQEACTDAVARLEGARGSSETSAGGQNTCAELVCAQEKVKWRPCS